jgi:hypothetical protein
MRNEEEDVMRLFKNWGLKESLAKAYRWCRDFKDEDPETLSRIKENAHCLTPPRQAVLLCVMAELLVQQGKKTTHDAPH